MGQLRVYELYSGTKWSVKICHHLSLLHGPDLWSGKEGYKLNFNSVIIGVSLCGYKRKSNERYI